jgi:beta-phosphoglucomutase-like phosphatase (HAD superfamily)
MQLDIPAGTFAGYIFDCDGTLIDSMPVHYRAWDEAMRRQGMPGTLDESLFYSLGGVPTRRVAELIAAHYGLTVDVDKVFHEKEALFVQLLADVKCIEPVVAFAKRAVAQGKPVSVASGGPREVVHHSLKLAGLAPLFPIVVTPEDVAHGKPAPDMFLLAAKKMGVPASKCLVFEDAEPGHQAAAAAGMQSVHVPSRGPRVK